MKKRYLTKSRFKIGVGCPTKLAYTDDKSYGNNNSQDEFLKALAESGYQVGELAKLYHPGGHDIETLNHDEAVAQTDELLKQENVTIYEAAIRHDNLFIRVDVLEKRGNDLLLTEVKAKSFDSTEEFVIFGKKELKKGNYVLNAEWGDYVLDLAFQTNVTRKAFPKATVFPALMLVDTSKVTSKDGLHQFFRIQRDENDRVSVVVKDEARTADLGTQVLGKQPLSHEIDHIINDCRFEGFGTFDDMVTQLSAIIRENRRATPTLSSSCKGCEFRIDEKRFPAGTRSGFKECWQEKAKLKDEDFEREFVFDVWDFRSAHKALDKGIIFASDLTEEDLNLKERDDDKLGYSRTERQLLQVMSAKWKKGRVEINSDQLAEEICKYHYPIHFIDFETAMMAIPFTKGRRPYEQLAYQFSHHTLHEDGRLEHDEYLDRSVGGFPNFNFVRALKKSLSKDNGAIMRFAAHENTVLNQIRTQLKTSTEADAKELIAWIESVTTPSKESDEHWEPKRQFIDMCDLTKRHYYLPETRGSNSIKRVLPAILNHAGRELQEKFPEWIKIDSDGRAKDPYKLLKPIFDDIDPAEIEKLEHRLVEREALNDGGAAMVAWARMQFTEMSELEREAICHSLLEYCKLDTLAMVMIWEWWQLQIKIGTKKAS